MWEEVLPVDQNGIIMGYHVFYTPLYTFAGEIKAEMVNTNITILVLENLHEYTDYNISVRAYTRAGAGPYSIAITHTTFQDGKKFTHYLICG